MKAVVLVGGEGTRLRPLTETVPKPLLPFMNRPFLHHVLDRLAGQGVEEAILSSPYLESEFRGFLDERLRAGEPRVRWITEEEALGTFGAIVGARDGLDETFLVCNGDILTDLDVRAMAAYHRSRGAEATIALTPVDDARPFGLVELDPGDRVVAFREKPTEPRPGDVNAGTYVLEPSVVAGARQGPASIERGTFPALIAGGRSVMGFRWPGYWRDLGTPASYLAAHLDALEGKVGTERYPTPLVAGDAVIDPSSAVGRLSVLGPAVQVGPGATVDRSVLHAGARVGRSARVTNTILGPASEVGAGAVVESAVLGPGERVPGAPAEVSRD